jgi:hypothetical protein
VEPDLSVDVLRRRELTNERPTAEASVSVPKREGELRGSTGHDPSAADFDEHVRFYKSTLRIAGIFIAHIVAILLVLYFFVVR